MGVLWDNRQIISGNVARIILFFAFFIMRSFAKNSSFNATFIFGDSLVDAGNNNYIVTLAKANYIPNGIDFGMPTGRFTNNRTCADIIGQELGLKNFTPPYLAPTTVGSKIQNGVNYASASAGILNETGKLLGNCISMSAQLDNFAKTRQDIITMIGAAAAEELLKNALFLVAIGSNDLITNYLLLPLLKPPPEVFVGNMVSAFRLQLTQLYNMGARKIVVANVPPIGSIPFERDLNIIGTDCDSCVPFPDQLALSFNSQLKSLLTELTANLMGSKFLYADINHILSDILENYMSYGFENANSACCSLAGNHGALIPCIPPSKVCFDRSKYMFWDSFHPSDAVNVIAANRMLHGDTQYISPINILQLLQS